MRYKANAEPLIYQLVFVVKRNAVIRALFIGDYLCSNGVPSASFEDVFYSDFGGHQAFQINITTTFNSSSIIALKRPLFIHRTSFAYNYFK
ncbi:hypothetical protein T4A_9351 [Trichinella pseudospiralis]|uniref:Uncharacterized protein n=1 Tax=Trichinella pseudospiralis TaxID=6337 RepID=A0A0V1DUV0_TRIPS|nr:hypothetical protein T4A_9351 [Trichinella pseudospiralis]